MKLYLLCAADSDATSPGLNDLFREDVVRVAGFLSLFARPKPQKVFHDGAVSSLQACALVQQQWQIPKPVLAESSLIDVLKQHKDDQEEWLFCAHVERIEALLRDLCPAMGFDVQHAHCWCFELFPHQELRLYWSITPALLCAR